MSAVQKTLIIGRGRDSGILLSHISISRRHAELSIAADGSAEIRDLQSTGGTFLLRGGKEIQVTQGIAFKPSDFLRFGEYEISGKDLLSLVPEEDSVRRSRRVSGTGGAPVAGSGLFPPKIESAPAKSAAPGKTRMMRCACGSIKERGKPCPDCGS